MSDPSFAIDTPRLHISYLQPDDDVHCDFLVELYNTPEFIAAEGGRPTPITNREKARERLAGRVRDEHARNGYGTYLVSLKQGTAENVPIGTLSLMRGDGPGSYTAPDLGFALLRTHMRKGYATEAARALLEYAEKELGVEAVLGLHDPGNEASRGVFRKLGFDDRGTRVLKMFGGVVGQVWTKPGMEDDLGSKRPDQTLPPILTDIFDAAYLCPLDLDLADPWLSPSKASDELLTEGLLESVILYTCKWDMLLREGEDFAGRLAAELINKSVRYRMTERVPHGWYKGPGPLSPPGRSEELYAECCEALKEVFEAIA